MILYNVVMVLGFGNTPKTVNGDYPPISDVKNCLIAYSAYIAFRYCGDVFHVAKTFSDTVKDVNFSNLAMNPYPDQIIEFFKTYSGPGSGGYFPGSGPQVGNVDAGQTKWDPNIGQTVVSVGPGGSEGFFNGVADYSLKCNSDAGIPTYKDPEFDQNTTKNGMVIIDVFKEGIKQCAFVALVVDSKIRMKIPEQYKTCIQNSDLMLANIEQLDSGGNLVSKKVISETNDFLVNEITADAKVTASLENSEKLESILAGLDLGFVSSNLKSIVSLNQNSINFDNIDQLDSNILKIVAICEYRVNPNNFQAEYPEFLLMWNDMEGNVVSATYGSKGGYYRAMYLNQYQNSKIYPHLKTLQDEFSQGLISPGDLYNWSGKASALCYMSYPKSWIRAYIIDYIIDGKIDDRSAIPSCITNTENM